jgi:3-oxoacyl-[acyl-carrier-protein] synthase II
VSDRLWITGVGLTTALGDGVEATWSALVRGERGIAPVTLFDATEQRVNLAAEVRGLAHRPGPGSALSRTGAMAVAAARESIAMARLVTTGRRVGLVVGSTTGGLFETELLLARLHVDPGCADALAGLAAYPLSGPAADVERSAGPFARVRTVSSACSSGAHALIVAASWLEEEELDAVVAGGSDSLCRLTLTGFNALAALDPRPCRPFDRDRQGTSLGEGAGFVVIERRRDARARGVRPVAELAGWASGADAFHVTNPEPSGHAIASLLEGAMRRAGLDPRGIDYVNAHGTGTRANDAAEAAALTRVLGAEALRIPVSSSKGQIGHTLAAAGAIEAVVTALVVGRDVLVPTGGLTEPDPDLGLLHVPRVGRPVERVRAALSNAFGFGGTNAVLVFTKPDLRDPSGLPGSPRPVAVVGWARTRIPDPAHDDLDAQRSRRLDAASRGATVAALRALGDAGVEPGACGVILGTAFGTVDGTAGFMHRVLERGTRLASPADFPNLLPSSAPGHVSIYAGLGGPLFAEVDPRASGEVAILDAVRLVAAGIAPRMLAGSSEVRSGAVVQALARVVDPGSPAREDGDVACLVLVDDALAARAAGRRALALVDQVIEWRGPARGKLGGLRPPSAPDAVVIFSRAGGGLVEALAESPWAERTKALAKGEKALPEVAGPGAFLDAVDLLGCGAVRQVLIAGASSSGGHAVLLARPPGEARA